MSRSVPVISLRENIAYNLLHVVPYYLRGIFTRNRFWYNLWSRFHPDPLGLRFISALRQKYQSDYLYLYLLTSKSLLVLDRAGIQHILAHSPTIYADGKLKRKGMSHFQPNALTISRGAQWTERRNFNEAVLNSGHSVHAYADTFLAIIRQELNAPEFAKSEVGWDELAALFERITLQILFGKGENATPVAEALSRMMRESNRVFALRPSHHFDGFYQHIRQFLANPRQQSLAYLSSATPSTAQTRVENQIPHWLFAMKDTLAENVVPTLALILSHPQVEERVRQEMANADLASAQGIAALRYLEACIEEAMRLWPTTPMLARESVVADSLEGIALLPGTQVIILNSFTHRDEQIAGDANHFLPERWLNGEGDDAITAVSNHFSSGPQVCAGKELALFVAKAVLATLLSGGRYQLLAPTLAANGVVPQTFNPFLARFRRSEMK
jgi:cytochrome P450